MDMNIQNEYIGISFSISDGHFDTFFSDVRFHLQNLERKGLGYRGKSLG